MLAAFTSMIFLKL